MMFVGNRNIKKTPNLGIEKFKTPVTHSKSDQYKKLDPKHKEAHMRNLLEGNQMSLTETTISLANNSSKNYHYYDDYAAFEWEELNKDVDREWYDNDEQGFGDDDYNMDRKFIGDAEVFEAMEKQLELRNQQMTTNSTVNNRISIKQREKSEEQNKWE